MLAFYLALIDNEQDQIKFEHLYNSYRKQMLFIAQSILHNSYDAEDAVHEAFIGIARNMDTVRKITDETDIKNYILKAAKNASVNMLRKKKKRDQIIDLDSISEISDDSFIESLADKITYDEITDALRKINPDYFDVLYYHFSIGMSCVEIAKLLNRKPATVRQQLVRGKKLALEKIKSFIKN